jgi:hypothetical protein
MHKTPAALPQLLLLPVAAMLLGAAAPRSIAVGVWTSEEDRHFAGERGAGNAPDWIGIGVSGAGDWSPIDAFGMLQGDWCTEVLPVTTDDDRVTIQTANGVATELRRSQPFTCWVSLRRATAKADGSADWSFHPGPKLHDQGGRALASDPDATPVVIRLRDVVWPEPSTNKPSLVLNVHKPDEPDKAVSYVWVDPKANLIGINLRWMQGSCSRKEMK